MIMKSKHCSCLLAMVLITSVCALRADEGEPTLKVGDPAPTLFSSQWINGAAVEKFDANKIYVVEFWATWCGPCKQSIPHLSEMNTEFKEKGVTFIGVDCLEKDTSKVETFVKEMGEKMNYTVAIDTPAGKGKSAQGWLDAAGQNGIPCAFIIDKAGLVAWIGHPMEMHDVLAQVVAGTFDAKKEAARVAKGREFQRRFVTAAKACDVKSLQAVADDVYADDAVMGAKYQANVFGFMLIKQKDYAAAYAYGNKIADNLSKDPDTMNEVSWTIMDAEGVEKRDIDLAMKFALKADEITKHENPAILDTLARAYFEKKDTAKAVEIETLAVSKAEGDMKTQLTETLTKYKAPTK